MPPSMCSEVMDLHFGSGGGTRLEASDAWLPVRCRGASSSGSGNCDLRRKNDDENDHLREWKWLSLSLLPDCNLRKGLTALPSEVALPFKA
mmetsp:Transcript_47777/g.126130  ORF Transcript_47777/g.126130 Transcript_47777/m.126130 type:complete len:91 (-) Transcript_47777:162-434(-)